MFEILQLSKNEILVSLDVISLFTSVPMDNVLDLVLQLQPTHTNRYLHCTLHYSKHQKLTVAETLLRRVNTHIARKTQKHSKLQNKSYAILYLMSKWVHCQNHFSNQLQVDNKLRTHNTIILFPFHTYKALQKTSKEF